MPVDENDARCFLRTVMSRVALTVKFVSSFLLIGMSCRV
jgi:hypothetical protein